MAEGTVIQQHPASQQLEQSYTEALNCLDCVFQDGLRALDQQFTQEQAKIIRVKELMEQVTEWLKQILQRTSTQMTAQEIGAVEHFEQLEHTIDILTSQTCEICETIGLPYDDMSPVLP